MSRKRRSAADEPFMLLRTSAADMMAGAEIGEHAHDWHQLIFVASGLMTVSAPAGYWVAPPSWGIWVPAHARHAIRFVARSRLRTLYCSRRWDADFPDRCTVIRIAPLLRELIVRATEHGMLDSRDPLDHALATLVAAELRPSDRPPFTLPQPTGRQTRHAADLIAQGAPEASSLASLARTIGLGVRSFERRFHAETGMTPGRWRQQHLLLAALERLAGGTPIKAVADLAGYASPSAFIAAFRKLFGTTPGRYFD